MANTLNLGDGNWATKENSLLGYNSENNNYKPLPFDFSRASSATRVNKDGLIETVGSGEPRIDFKDDTKGALLLEPSSTNLALYSEDFSQSDWSVFDVSKSANSVLSPDGTLNGARLTALSGTNKVFQQLVTVSADPSNNRVFTGSIYIKSSSVTSCFLRVGSSTSNNAITISNEWQRFEAQYTLAATFTAVRLGIVLNNEGDEVDVAFGQVEEKPYATSYIPTQGGVGTRLADSCNNGGNEQVINSTEGVLYANFYAEADNTEKWISLSDGTSTNRIIVYIPSANTLRIYVQNSSGGQVDFATSITLGQYNKVAFKYKENDFALFLNGTNVGTDTSGGVPIGLDRLNFADKNGTTNPFIGNVKDVRVYNTALTDLELQALTS